MLNENGFLSSYCPNIRNETLIRPPCLSRKSTTLSLLPPTSSPHVPHGPALRDIEKKFKATKDLRIVRILVELIWADWTPPFSGKLLPE
jgi:hypothetical protein